MWVAKLSYLLTYNLLTENAVETINLPNNILIFILYLFKLLEAE